MATKPGLTDKEGYGTLGQEALKRMQETENYDAFISQNPHYNVNKQRLKYRELATVAAKEKSQSMAQAKDYALRADEHKALNERFQKKFDEQKRQHEQGRTDAAQARKDAEPGFVGSLFGK